MIPAPPWICDVCEVPEKDHLVSALRYKGMLCDALTRPFIPETGKG